jgi:ammonia channel protein AmtB
MSFEGETTLTTPLVVATTTTMVVEGDDDEQPQQPHSTIGPALASQQKWTNLFGYLQLILLVFFIWGFPKLEYDGADVSMDQYAVFRDVMVMLLLGFGYLMSFLSRFGVGAMGYVLWILIVLRCSCLRAETLNHCRFGCFSFFWRNVLNDALNIQKHKRFTMLATVVAMELNIAVELLCRLVYHGLIDGSHGAEPLRMGFSTLIDGQFAAATLLISLGAVIGRVTPVQLAIMAVCQALPYAFNKVVIVFGLWSAEDVGGTMTIHMFGAFFGLSVSYVLGPPQEATIGNASPNKVSNVMALIGTTLLWVCWPSFVAATELTSPQNCLIHTIMALLGSTLASFYMSQKLCLGKLDLVHIARSTLAGGVAVGSSARLVMRPGGALLLGMLAGIVSVYGYAYSTPYLQKSFGIWDTCGVGNLHGWPSVLGGISSAIFVLFNANAGFLSHGVVVQMLCQILGVVSTILIAVASGYGTGLLMVQYGSLERKPDEYDDAVWYVLYFGVASVVLLYVL